MLQEDLIYIADVFTPEQCKKLIDEFEIEKERSEGERCAHAITGVDTQSTFKRIELKPYTETFDMVHNATKTMVRKWVDYLTSLNCLHVPIIAQNLNFAHMYRLMCYEKGGWIHPHTDWDNFCHASCTISLNDNFEGGQFSFFNGKYDVDLKPGQAMIFPANAYWVHEVKEVTKGKRYSTNCFILSVPLEKQFELNTFAKSLQTLPNVRNHDLRF